MPIPDRPVSGASIESVWGQQIHDYTFAPAGCEVAGGGTTLGTTIAALDLSVTVDDPGGFHDAANDRIEIPTDKGGLYLLTARAKSGDGTTGQSARLALLLNGSYIAFANIELETALVTPFAPIACVLTLSAGDIISFGVLRFGGGGAGAYVNMESCQLVRIGAAYGA